MDGVVVVYDLTSHDGRAVVEVRRVIGGENAPLYTAPETTVYSCAYNSQLGRIVAFNRAVQFSRDLGQPVIDFCSGNGHTAYWQ